MKCSKQVFLRAEQLKELGKKQLWTGTLKHWLTLLSVPKVRILLLPDNVQWLQFLLLHWIGRSVLKDTTVTLLWLWNPQISLFHPCQGQCLITVSGKKKTPPTHQCMKTVRIKLFWKQSSQACPSTPRGSKERMLQDQDYCVNILTHK